VPLRKALREELVLDLTDAWSLHEGSAWLRASDQTSDTPDVVGLPKTVSGRVDMVLSAVVDLVFGSRLLSFQNGG
jgi:hypothetical protein